MVMILRRRGSTKVGGPLVCPRCSSPKVKFVGTVGFDTDRYVCRVCRTPISYMTTPFTGNVDLRDVSKRPGLLVGKNLNVPRIWSRIPLIGKSKKNKLGGV